MTMAPVCGFKWWEKGKRHELISDEYLAQQRALHLMPQGYGGKGSRWAPTVLWLAKRFECHSVLDYGCGRGSLKLALEENGLACREYDPAVDGKDGPPVFADLVVCTDVLEHVEEDRINNVLKHLDGLARRLIFLVISLRPSNKVLPDGRNAHVLLRSAAWWDAKTEDEGWEQIDGADTPIPPKVDREKHWIAALRPRR